MVVMGLAGWRHYRMVVEGSVGGRGDARVNGNEEGICVFGKVLGCWESIERFLFENLIVLDDGVGLIIPRCFIYDDLHVDE